MEPNQISVHRMDLYEGFELLETQLRIFQRRLREQSDYPLFVNGPGGSTDPRGREAVIHALTAIHYEDGQPVNEVVRCPALVGTNAGTLELAAGINEVKAKLHRTLMALDGVEAVDDNGDGTVEVLNVALRRLGHARLQRRQATRRIETLESAPDGATFTWSRARRKEVLSAGAVRERLLHALGETRGPYRGALEAELARLDELDDDVQLVRLTGPYEHPRVNLLWRLPDGQVLRKQRRAVVPLLYPASPGEALPRIRPLPGGPAEVQRRKRRTDLLIDEAPLIPSLGVHRVISTGMAA